jgi:hypothetical protein
VTVNPQLRFVTVLAMESAPDVVALSALTTQVMGVRSADSFGAALGDLLCVQDGFKFFGGLQCASNSAGDIRRGAWVFVSHNKTEMGLLAGHPEVPDPCTCVSRVESIFQDSEDDSSAVQCTLMCSYFPEAPELASALASALVTQPGLELGTIVAANDRLVLPASRVMGCVDFTDPGA